MPAIGKGRSKSTLGLDLRLLDLVITHTHSQSNPYKTQLFCHLNIVVFILKMTIYSICFDIS